MHLSQTIDRDLTDILYQIPAEKYQTMHFISIAHDEKQNYPQCYDPIMTVNIISNDQLINISED